MKKLITLFILLCSSLALSGCTVNWAGGSFDVPWYIMTVIILGMVAAVYLRAVTKPHTCRNCGAAFMPKWYQFSVCIHFNGKRIIKCPNCKRRGYCDTE